MLKSRASHQGQKAVAADTFAPTAGLKRGEVEMQVFCTNLLEYLTYLGTQYAHVFTHQGPLNVKSLTRSCIHQL